LESILLLTEGEGFVHRIEIAKKMGVSQAAVNKAVKLLQEKNYVYEDGKHLYLTEEGKAHALAVFERHCILREFF
jgi:Mn-dependent DtxR family transcriptional regulator